MAQICIYTAITTIIAFLSLLMADIKPVIDFGLMMTLGLTVVYATTFLLFPSILVLTKKRASKSSSGLGSFVKLTAILGIFTEKRPKTILTLSFALLILVCLESIDFKSKIALFHTSMKKPISIRVCL